MSTKTIKVWLDSGANCQSCYRSSFEVDSEDWDVLTEDVKEKNHHAPFDGPNKLIKELKDNTNDNAKTNNSTNSNLELNITNLIEPLEQQPIKKKSHSRFKFWKK